MRKTLTKKEKVTMELSVSTALRYGMDGMSIRNPILSEKEKSLEEKDNAEMNYLEAGERGFIARVKRLLKFVVKNKYVYYYEDGTFTLYADILGSEYPKEITVYEFEGCFFVSNNEFTAEYFSCEFHEVSNLFDFINSTYVNKANGLIVRR